MYYFFGAGSNCYGALKFFGKENVKAIVDNNEAKFGTTLCGVPIISVDELVARIQDEMVIITAFLASREIINQLEENGIMNYYVCPFMQSGFYDCDTMIDEWELTEYESFAVYDANPISELILKKVQEKKGKACRIVELTEEEWRQGVEGVAEILLVIKDGIEESDFVRFSGYQQVISLFTEMNKKRTRDYKHLQQYRDLHKGERCVLVGNGPSLCAQDLDRICQSGVVSIGCNQIQKIFEDTKWRPKYCVIGDGLVYERNKGLWRDDMTYFLRKFVDDSEVGDNVILYSGKAEQYYPGYPHFSDDLVQGVYGGRSVMYDMLQIAVYLGFKEIYLIGVDFSWGEDGKGTHFCEGYVDSGIIRAALGYKEEQRHAYISAKRFAEEHGIKIYNATRGGYLDVFERVDFDEIFGE